VTSIIYLVKTVWMKATVDYFHHICRVKMRTSTFYASPDLDISLTTPSKFNFIKFKISWKRNQDKYSETWLNRTVPPWDQIMCSDSETWLNRTVPPWDQIMCSDSETWLNRMVPPWDQIMCSDSETWLNRTVPPWDQIMCSE
jgi:hypothetical protein